MYFSVVNGVRGCGVERWRVWGDERDTSCGGGGMMESEDGSVGAGCGNCTG